MAKMSLTKIRPILEAIDSGSDLSKWEVMLSERTIKRASEPIKKMLSFSS